MVRIIKKASLKKDISSEDYNLKLINGKQLVFIIIMIFMLV